MIAELGATDDPRTLVPGDPTAVAADARALAGRAAALVRTGEALRRIGTGAWTGRAADAWRERHDEDAARWFQGADSLDAAAGALAGHADALARAQAEAARAVDLWRRAEAASADVERRVASGAVAPATDPGDEPRRRATEILAAARTELLRSGDRVASALRGEATLAPRDSQQQIDADFYGGIWDSIAGAGEGLWTLASDPAQAVAGVVAAVAHPSDTAKDAIAYDDWTQGREPRALGRNTGDMLVGAVTLGAGKITSILGRETRIAGEADAPAERTPHEPAAGQGPVGPAARAEEVRRIVLDADGNPHGVEDSREVFVVDGQILAAMREQFHQRLGSPDSSDVTGRGERETWYIGTDPKTTVTYRSFSSSGGATIDVNKVDGAPLRRFHVG